MKTAITKLKFHTNQTPEQLRELEDCWREIDAQIAGNPKLALEKTNQYEVLSLKYGHKKHLAKQIYQKAHLLYILGKNQESFECCKAAIRSTKDNELLYKIHICLGAVYTQFGQFSDAINSYNSALELNEKSVSPSIFNNIAAIYFKQKDYSNAIIYLEKALEIEVDNNNQVVIILNNIGRAYIELKDLQTAEKILESVYRMLDEIDNPSQEMISHLNIGLLYLKQERYSEAYQRLSNAYLKCKELDLKNNLYSATFFLAQACSKNNMPDQANLYFIEAVELVRKSDKRLYVNTLKDYIDFLTEQEDYLKASKYFKEYDQVKDRIIQEEKEKEINELSIKFRNTEQKLEIEKLTKEKEMQSALIAQAEEIKRYNEELVLSNAHLSQANSQLMETKILRSQMNPHFVYNTLNSISSLIKSKQNKAADQYLHVFSNLTRRIFDNNAQSSISLFEELDFCAQYILLEKLRFGDKINYVQTIDPAINIESINIPSMIIQPLLENAIKHGVFHLKKKQIGIIQLNIQQQKEQLLFEIIDNGIGIKGSINDVLQSNQESAIHIVNKRINIYNQQDLDSQSLLLENTGSAGLKCSFILKQTANGID